MPASRLLLIEPVNFSYNPETAVNNSLQKNISGYVQEKALQEFQTFVALLNENKVAVTVMKDTAEPFTPDSIFPNNWISFHDDNSIFLYPMFAPNRRLERKESVLAALKRKFAIDSIHDLSQHEKNGLYLEGTGSMVLDRVNKIAYAAISPRTNLDILLEFCRIGHYTPVSFISKDKTGKEIYHSNVMMCMADDYVVICLDTLRDQLEKDRIVQIFRKTNKAVIEISLEQMEHFAGNMLQIKNSGGELLLVMSTQAYQSLNREQLTTLERYNRIVHSPLDTIEACGGGSARCMMAEVYNDLA